MPTSLPPSDETPRRRLPGDMYFSGAEQRHHAEVAATRLLETTTPVTSTLSGARIHEEASVATDASGVAFAYTPEQGGAAKPAVTEPALEAPVIDITARKSNPLASFRSEVLARSHPGPATAQRFHPVRRASRDSGNLVTATALGTVAIVALGAIALMFWPGTGSEAPAITQATVASADSRLVDSEAAASDTSPSAVATSSGVAASNPATRASQPSDSVRLPATVPARKTGRPLSPVARTSNQSPTPITPVSRPSVAQLRVTSSPSGARVTINGIGWGKTPVTVDNLPLGAKTVRLSFDGYRSQQRTVDLRSAGAQEAVHVALKADSGSVNR